MSVHGTTTATNPAPAMGNEFKTSAFGPSIETSRTTWCAIAGIVAGVAQSQLLKNCHPFASVVLGIATAVGADRIFAYRAVAQRVEARYNLLAQLCLNVIAREIEATTKVHNQISRKSILSTNVYEELEEFKRILKNKVLTYDDFIVYQQQLPDYMLKVFDAADKTITRQNEQNVLLGHQLEDQKAATRNLNVLLTREKDEVRVLNKTVKDKNQEIRSLKAEKDDLVTKLETIRKNFSEAIAKKDQEIKDLKDIIEEFKKSISEKDLEINGLKSEVEELKKRISEKDLAINDLKSEVQELKKSADEKDAKSEKQDLRIQKLEKEAWPEETRLRFEKMLRHYEATEGEAEPYSRAQPPRKNPRDEESKMAPAAAPGAEHAKTPMKKKLDQP